MKNKINGVLSLFMFTVLILGFSGAANAATYQYINTSGQLDSVTADTAQQAIATAHNIDSQSGVMLVSNNNTAVTTTTEVTTTTQVTTEGQEMYLYQYINTSGQLDTVRANTAQQAIATAHNIDAQSGVMLVN